MSKPKVLITHPEVPKIAFDLLSEKFDVICNVGDPPSRADILSKIPGVDALFWSTKERLDKEILDVAGPQLRVVGTMSAGVDHIDVKELKSRRIPLGNTSEVLNHSVADVAVMLTLAAQRRMHEGRLQMTTNAWKFSVNWLLGQDIRDSTVGIVGLGGIGQEIVKRLKGFGVARFIYSGHREKPEGKALGANFVTFDELLRESDIIIAACPLTPETEEMFNEEAFNKMKQTAVFVNVARGKIVDQSALIKALETNTIFAAGLDVMTPEPLPTDHKLYTLPNCVLIPHLGSATIQTRNKMAEITAKNILAIFNNEPMPSPL